MGRGRRHYPKKSTLCEVDRRPIIHASVIKTVPDHQGGASKQGRDPRTGFASAASRHGNENIVERRAVREARGGARVGALDRALSSAAGTQHPRQQGPVVIESIGARQNRIASRWEAPYKGNHGRLGARWAGPSDGRAG